MIKVTVQIESQALGDYSVTEFVDEPMGGPSLDAVDEAIAKAADRVRAAIRAGNKGRS